MGELIREPEMAPLLRAAVMDVVACWNDLGAERQIGFGVMGCIPFPAVVRWCKWHGWDREDTVDLWRIIRKLDADRVEREGAKRRAEAGGS